MSKTVKNIMKDLGVTSFLKNTSDYITHAYFLNRSIGLSRKSYAFMKATLSRNIGDNIHEYDGYGTPIGEKADFFFNAKQNTTLFLKDFDKNKKNTTNYIEYINQTFFNENGGITNINNGLETQNSDSLKVGVVRSIDFSDEIDTINPNKGNTDTQLGFIGKNILYKTILDINNETNRKQFTPITSKVYTDFYILSDYGIEKGYNKQISGRVKTQDELISAYGSIPWSTSDHEYDSTVVGKTPKRNLNIVKNIFDLPNEKELSIVYNDKTKNSDEGTLYYPFGNFYSNTYSLGLFDSTNEQTKEFISKSMLGYDLLGNDKPDKNMRYSDITAPKKYFVGEGTRGSNYIDAISGTDVKFIKYFNERNSLNEIVRIEIPDMGNDTLWSARALYTYAEMEGNSLPSTMGTVANTHNEGIEYGKFIAYDKAVTSNKKDIVHYTNRMFQEGNYKTLISRFHTDEIGVDGSRGNRDITSTALSQYGMSHGRNLLKKDHKNAKENGYSNPYCRTWTYHHQYKTLKDTIRPFDEKDDIKTSGVYAYRTTNGIDHLNDYGVKQANKLVRITPTKDAKDNFGIKRCMFSIENLAWKGEKDFFKGREDQKGPLGGRIMWFPPYDLNFSENVNVNWSQNQFIGRGESIYTYTNTERGGQLSFKLLIDHPSIVNQWRGIVNGGEGIGDVDDTESNEQQLLRFFAGCELLKVRNPEDIKEEKIIPKIEPKVKDVEVPTPKTDKLIFYVFYPNNYTGVDDIKNGSVVSPMEYLLNGIGANKYLHTEGKTNKTIIKDLPTQLKETRVGYEMGIKGGISNVTNVKDIDNGYSSILTSITSNSNNINIGYQYLSSNKAGKPNYWAYRCDKAYENQVLHTYNDETRYNYYDLEDYGLNSNVGCDLITQVHTEDRKYFEEGKIYSFADVFQAIQGGAENVLTSDQYFQENVKKIQEIIGINKEKYTISSIEVVGFASSHGYKNSNDVLGKNRANTIVEWLKTYIPKKFNNETVVTYDTHEGTKLSHYNSSSLEAKIWRCSRVVLNIKQEEVIQHSETIDLPKDNSRLHNITYRDNKRFETIKESNSLAKTAKSLNKESFTDLYIKTFGKKDNVAINAAVNQIEENKSEADAKAMSAKTNGNTINILGDGKIGYGKEYEFFSELNANEPFLHSKLVEKLKYFDPAFHSITPEGFQSRLTFLHQCTRQGNTASASDSNNMNRTANNLAFGRPPICVLRIGDFYNTKIIIESLSIDYNDTTWDLNDEGIGVMPMMANVTIGFKFLGGSDLSGPINRLQNALSFNHYANTSVYDDRAEEIFYNDEGEIINFNFKPNN